MKFPKYPPLFVITTSLVVFFDQLVKFLVVTFEPTWTIWFVTIHTASNTGAAFGILQDHGATIEVNSEVGVGTEFCIRFPVMAD